MPFVKQSEYLRKRREEKARELFRLRLPLAFLWGGKNYELALTRLNGSITVGISSWNVRPYDSGIFVLIREGHPSLTALVHKYLMDGRASAKDCDPSGVTLLEVSANLRTLIASADSVGESRLLQGR